MAEQPVPECSVGGRNERERATNKERRATGRRAASNESRLATTTTRTKLTLVTISRFGSFLRASPARRAICAALAGAIRHGNQARSARGGVLLFGRFAWAKSKSSCRRRADNVGAQSVRATLTRRIVEFSRFGKANNTTRATDCEQARVVWLAGCNSRAILWFPLKS